MASGNGGTEGGGEKDEKDGVSQSSDNGKAKNQATRKIDRRKTGKRQLHHIMICTTLGSIGDIKAVNDEWARKTIPRNHAENKCAECAKGEKICLKSCKQEPRFQRVQCPSFDGDVVRLALALSRQR